MKFCKDCRWRVFTYCEHPEVYGPKDDPVKGRVMVNLVPDRSCAHLRGDDGSCGADAKWFERSSWWHEKVRQFWETEAGAGW